jgi:hypothetical protein
VAAELHAAETGARLVGGGVPPPELLLPEVVDGGEVEVGDQGVLDAVSGFGKADRIHLDLRDALPVHDERKGVLITEIGSTLARVIRRGAEVVDWMLTRKGSGGCRTAGRPAPFPSLPPVTPTYLDV